jgi:hypothetical protein
MRDRCYESLTGKAAIDPVAVAGVCVAAIAAVLAGIALVVARRAGAAPTPPTELRESLVSRRT